MPIQSYLINYPKRRISYRGGEYPYRSVSCFLKESPEIKIRTLVTSETLWRILSDDVSSVVPEVVAAGEALIRRIGFSIVDIWMINTVQVLKDVVSDKYKDYEIISVT